MEAVNEKAIYNVAEEPQDELREAIVAFLFLREELRCAEIQDKQGLIVACIFGPLFLLTIFICGAFVVNFLRNGRYSDSVYPALLILLSILGSYLVKNAYDYGRRSYKVALNLNKDRVERLVRCLPASTIHSILQAGR
jgi:hypothetical protein